MIDKKQIARVWVDDHAVHAETTDGLRASYAFSLWPRLRDASDAERRDFYLSHLGIHWPSIDEDLSFEGMFHHAGLCELTDTEDSVYYNWPYDFDDETPLPSVAEAPAGYRK